jgi:transcription elongation factor GreA
MLSQTQYLTSEGRREIEERLKYLTEVRRVEVTERLRRALDERGDLNENAEYNDAKNEQAFIEEEIFRLENILCNAQTIKAPKNHNRVALGSVVTMMEEGSTAPETYQLVGSAEANPGEGKIPIECPLGRAMLGANAGDRVTVNAPGGKLIFIIKAIR